MTDKEKEDFRELQAKLESVNRELTELALVRTNERAKHAEELAGLETKLRQKFEAEKSAAVDELRVKVLAPILQKEYERAAADLQAEYKAKKAEAGVK